ncbi:MAG: hypothetical protein ACYTBJ_05310 [Planctomycetota bacterium]|jgi:hypothetical protein
MNPFMEGFADELEKLALIGGVARAAGKAGKWAIKKPMRRIALPAFFAMGSVEAAKAISRRGKHRLATRGPGQPSKAWYINYHKALGLPKRLTKLQEQRLSRNFARYRERK